MVVMNMMLMCNASVIEHDRSNSWLSSATLDRECENNRDRRDIASHSSKNLKLNPY